MASSILQSCSIFCGMKTMSNAEKLSSPCLIPPSSYEAGYNKLYSLAEKKVVSIDKAAAGWPHSMRTTVRRSSSIPSPVKLPDIDHAFPSPDAHDCRRIMRYAPSSGIAVCSPGRSSCLTNKSDSDLELECWGLHHPWSFLWKAQIYTSHGYEDEHYHCPRYLVIDEHSDRLFVVIRVVSEEGGDRIDEPASFCKLCGNYKEQYCRCGNNEGDERSCNFLDSYTTCPRLENWSQHMVQQAMLDMYNTEKRNGDISEDEDEEEEDGGLIRYSHKTIRFHVYEIDHKKKEMRYMDASLDGLAMFVGSNHSFALPAADFNLSPDSIYFTQDGVNCISQGGGNDDVGIYNYVDGKISSIDYPSQSQTSTTSTRIAPAMWLTPLPH